MSLNLPSVISSLLPGEGGGEGEHILSTPTLILPVKGEDNEIAFNGSPIVNSLCKICLGLVRDGRFARYFHLKFEKLIRKSPDTSS